MKIMKVVWPITGFYIPTTRDMGLPQNVNDKKSTNTCKATNKKDHNGRKHSFPQTIVGLAAHIQT